MQNHIDSGLDTISISSKRLTDAAQKAVSGFKDQLDSGSKKHLNRSGEELDHFQELVQQMGPEKTMKRGYALPFDQHGKVIRNAKDTKPMDQIKLRFNDGTITVVRKE